MLAIVLALAAAAGYGGSDYAAGLAARKASVIRVTILAELATVAMMAVILPWTVRSGPALVPVAWGVAGGVGGVLGALALYVGFRHAAFSVAASLSAVGSAGFSVLAGLLFGERPGGLSLLGIALALPAIVGVSASGGIPASTASTVGTPSAAGPAREGTSSGGPHAALPEHRPAGPTHHAAGSGRHAAGVIWGLVAGLCFAVLFIALNRAGSRDGLWPVAAAQLAALVSVCCIGATRRSLSLPAPGARLLAVVTGLTGCAGTIMYFLATHAGLLAVTAVITSLYPAVTIVLARTLLGERLTRIRLAGLCLAAASVALIAAGAAG